MSLEGVHLACCIAAAISACMLRAWPALIPAASAVVVDLVYLQPTTWAIESALALVGPASVVLASTLTFGVRPSRALALAAPIPLLAPYILAEGPRLGSAGIAWILVGAHAYAALVGLVALAMGHDQAPRLHVRLVALFLATSAPSAYGWTCRALGGSMRPAAVLDTVFLAAIVVWSIAAWKTRPSTSFSPLPSARCSGR